MEVCVNIALRCVDGDRYRIPVKDIVNELELEELESKKQLSYFSKKNSYGKKNSFSQDLFSIFPFNYCQFHNQQCYVFLIL